MDRQFVAWHGAELFLLGEAIMLLAGVLNVALHPLAVTLASLCAPLGLATIALGVQHAPITARDARPRAIVLVEDQPDILHILHRLMRELVSPDMLIAVASGPAALKQLALYDVPLLITDYNMPGMNGLQLAQAVKDASSNTRVVLITADDTPELKRQLQASGVDAYLPKPFALAQIEQIVRDSLPAR